MSFQAYIDNITAQTKQTPEQIKDNAMKQGILKPDLRANDWVNYLAKEYNLGRGHSMALWKYFIEKGWISTKHTSM